MYKKSNKRKLQAIKTRQMIHQSATRLFAEHGFENVTVEEIAAGAGVSVGAFYHHFKGKEEIFTIFYKTLDEHYVRYYEDVICSHDFTLLRATEKLEKFMLYTIEISASQGADYLRIFYPYMLRDPELSNSMINMERAIFIIVGEIVDEGEKKGEFIKGLNSTQIACDLVKIARGCLVYWCMNNGREDIRASSANLFHYYLKGISVF
ncbi:MAG: TetR/AcrR family transcriptional regulator [Synergistaceae bacterium]|nr:TetR/AcrR family transcriptional regulator [Synergistaceae bacterium]